MPSVPARSTEGFVTVRSTRVVKPFQPNAERQPILTERLLLRAVHPDDITAFHASRSQPEVMEHTVQGRVDKDVAESQERLDKQLPPNDVNQYTLSICLRETGEWIGLGGQTLWDSPYGWPEVGYAFSKDHWGKGYGTEFLRAWLAAWEQLPREEADILVDARTAEVDGATVRIIPEQLFAVTNTVNSRSQGVLRKCGFEEFGMMREPDSRDPSKMIDLPTFRYILKGPAQSNSTST